MMALEPTFLLLSPPVATWLPSAVLNLWLYMMDLRNYKNIIKFQTWWEGVHIPQPPPQSQTEMQNLNLLGPDSPYFGYVPI